ncbi:TrkH family potassium uptake protein [Flammeovirga kamogawensis]|uniref:Potassium transporter n=1 Tax=Flammeovirga kamogawensis TaxID=373891 RepID=A0ABX8GXW9_9BACT|nr:potassium transporter TrkG [Flammeovirga kamogawensis]MBB6460889.1 potassium uptake TrkH family protein [Flammeovirga kamogawensis]QWG08234.1 hypothetical protein KM029_04665 [Flammeovirga kamogawensis]TRX70037.1 hypothetical protein EO216_18600 [Flammeovirga kamogawensis]
MSDHTKYKFLKFILRTHKSIISEREEWIRKLKKKLDKNLPFFELIIGALAFISLVYTQGFNLTELEIISWIKYDRWIVTFYAFLIILKLLLVKDKVFSKEHFMDIVFLSMILGILYYRLFILHNYDHPVYHNLGWDAYIIIVQVIMIIASLVSLANNRSYWLFFTANSTTMIIGSLLIIVVLGTILLKLPECTNQPITWVDAWFTAMSAVCVTGLAPFNIAEVLTFKGQLILMFLFQIGGLGVVSLTTFIALTIQKGVKTKEEFVIQDMMESESISSSALILKRIVYITLIVELIGAVCLFFAWSDLDLLFSDLVFKSIFHSISAFCNAGFSNFHDGLQDERLSVDWFSGTIIMLLIVIGGLGFRTYHEVLRRKQKYQRHLSLQSRLSLQGTAVLIVVGTIGVYLTDISFWNEKSFSDGLLQTLFTSITCRTAGFSVVEIGDLSVATIMMMILLMYIGGAPNSTAGGVKVTTVYVLLKYFFAQIRGNDHVHVGWNTIKEASIRRAIIVFMMSIMLSFISLFILTISEAGVPPEDILFEYFSALGTAGLSRGITGELSVLGKFLISFVMFSGKIGLFTLVSLLGENNDNFKYRYPEAQILVG